MIVKSGHWIVYGKRESEFLEIVRKQLEMEHHFSFKEQESRIQTYFIHVSEQVISKHDTKKTAASCSDYMKNLFIWLRKATWL